MTFMYLHLRADKDCHIHATVQKTGEEPPWLGSQNTRRSDSPFAVFQIESFRGLGNIDDKNLLDEVMRRFTTKELTQKLGVNLTVHELLDMVKSRLGEDW